MDDDDDDDGDDDDDVIEEEEGRNKPHIHQEKNTIPKNYRNHLPLLPSFYPFLHYKQKYSIKNKKKKG